MEKLRNIGTATETAITGLWHMHTGPANVVEKLISMDLKVMSKVARVIVLVTTTGILLSPSPSLSLPLPLSLPPFLSLSMLHSSSTAVAVSASSKLRSVSSVVIVYADKFLPILQRFFTLVVMFGTVMFCSVRFVSGFAELSLQG